MSWKLLSFASRSKQRKEIIFAMKNPTTPTEIASKVKVSVSHVSRTLKEFQDKGLVECKTPKEKVGRIYALTKKGKDVLKKMSN